MQVYSGDDTGLVKRVALAARCASGAPAARWGEQARGGGVGRLWSGTLGGEDLIGAGLDSGAVRFWSEAALEPVASFDAHAGPGVGAVAIRAFGGAAPRVVACDRRGCVRVWRWPASPAESKQEEPVQALETGGKPVGAADVDEAGGLVATCGKGRELELWDLATGASTFKARNVPNDNLDLEVPVWPSGVAFVPQSGIVALSTGFVDQRLRGEVRLYDAAAKRRPVVRKLAPVGDEAVTALGVTPDGRYVLAGSCSGNLARLDVRTGLKVVCRYKGAAGAIRDVTCHPTLPYFASASLDRHVRVYATEARSGAPACKVYLKQRVVAAVFSAALPARAGQGGGADEVDAMLDALPDAEEGVGEGVEEEGEGEDAVGGAMGDAARGADSDDGMGELDNAEATELSSAAVGAARADDEDEDEALAAAEMSAGVSARAGGGGAAEAAEEEVEEEARPRLKSKGKKMATKKMAVVAVGDTPKKVTVTAKSGKKLAGAIGKSKKPAAATKKAGKGKREEL